MRRKVGTKIFAILMSAFIFILIISMNLSVDAQFKLHATLLQQGYGFWDVYEQINEKFTPSRVSENESESHMLKLLNEVKSSDFKQKLGTLSEGARNFVFVTTPFENIVNEEKELENNPESSIKSRDKILSYTLDQSPFSSDYICLVDTEGEGEYYSIESFSEEQKASLFTYIQSNNKRTVEDDDYEWGMVEYSLQNNKIDYLKWGEQFYGKKTERVKKANITLYSINGNHCMYDFLRGRYDSFNINDMKFVVENYIDFRSGDGSYVSANFTVGDATYIVMETPYLYSESSSGTYSSFIVVNVVHGLRDFVTQQYLEQSTSLYTSAFIMAIIVSWLFSYMIAKPIKKVEKAAVKIASQNFDEPLLIKSKDEIGSLAKSVDSMRIQLKETIENLQKEIEKVKTLESLRKDFINQFTHEMKTPLGIINGYSELIEETRNEEEINKYLNIINRETNRVNELIQSMLKLSRLEAKKVELNHQDIDLEESIASIIDQYEVLLMKKNIKVDVQVYHSSIYADKKHIETVIHNFLSNAIKHTKESHKIIITIDNGVSIYNQGTPIETDRIENIWHTFVTHDREGSGLGLAICRSILDLHEFEYGVENKLDGVTFYFKVK